MMRSRTAIIGTGLAALAAAGLFSASVALGATSKAQPSMEVKPSTKGLHYQQTVEVKGHHLPKGSGSVAATICGLQDSAGKSIKKPTADDCAGAKEIGKLVVVKQWQSNGEFDTKYTLPANGETFGNNKRFCNKTHHCALVVADANPDHPAYYIATPIEFVDQAAKPSTTQKPTSKPKPKSAPTTTTTTTQPAIVSTSSNASGNGDQSHAQMQLSVSASVNAPSGPPQLPALPTPGSSPVPPPVASAITQACNQLAAAVKQAGGDPTALLTACDGVTSGNGPQELQALLTNPSLLCVEGASAWQNNAQITDACNQAAAGLAPATSATVGALAPVLGGL
jgi:hypothetical protein